MHRAVLADSNLLTCFRRRFPDARTHAYDKMVRLRLRLSSRIRRGHASGRAAPLAPIMLPFDGGSFLDGSVPLRGESLRVRAVRLARMRGAVVERQHVVL